MTRKNPAEAGRPFLWGKIVERAVYARIRRIGCRPNSNTQMQNNTLQHAESFCHQALNCYKSVITPQWKTRAEFTYQHGAIMYARACRAWYGPRGHCIVKRTIAELARAGDHEGVEAWSQVADQLTKLQTAEPNTGTRRRDVVADLAAERGRSRRSNSRQPKIKCSQLV
jgi:hypothetical protein